MAGGVEMILTSSKILNISDETDMFILSRHLFWPSKGSLWSRSINSFWYLPIADLSKDLLTHLLTYLLTYLCTKSIIIFSSKVGISNRSTWILPISIWTWFLQFSSLKYQVWWTGFLVYFKLEFYRLQQAEKFSRKKIQLIKLDISNWRIAKIKCR